MSIRFEYAGFPQFGVGIITSAGVGHQHWFYWEGAAAEYAAQAASLGFFVERFTRTNAEAAEQLARRHRRRMQIEDAAWEELQKELQAEEEAKKSAKPSFAPLN